MIEDSLKKRYGIKLFANIIGGIIGAIFLAIVPKSLGPIAYGQFVYIQEFFTQIMGFLDMGSSTALLTKLSARHTRKELITFYFIFILFILFFLLIMIFLIDKLGLLQITLPDIPNQYVYMGLIFGFFTWVTQIFIKISDAYALTVSVEFIKVGHKIISLFLILYLIYAVNFDLSMYFYFQYTVFASFLMILTWLFIKKSIFDKKIFSLKFGFKALSKEFFIYCSPLVIYSVASVLVGLFDIWLLQKMAGSEQTGLYGLAYSIAAMCFLFTSAMTPIITREFAKSFEQKNLIQIRKLFSRYIPMLYSIAAYFAIFVSFQSENLLAIFTDERFKTAHLVLVVMAFYPIHQTYGQLSGSIFYATEQTKLYKNIGLLSMSIGLVLSIFFIYILDLGPVGLAWKMTLGQLIAVNIQLCFNSKFLNLDLKHFIMHQFYSILFFIIIAFVTTSFISVSSPLIEFLISGVVYTILVIIGGYIFPQIFSLDRYEIRILLSKVSNVIKK